MAMCFRLIDTYSYTEIFAETVESEIKAKLGVNDNQGNLKTVRNSYG